MLLAAPVAVLALTSAPVSAGAAAPDDPIPAGLAGRWAGAAVENGTVTLLELELAVEDDELTAILTQPYSGYTRFPYPFDYEDGFVVSRLFGGMRLLVDLEHGELRGTVERDGIVSKTVQLKRVLALPRPGHREEEVRFRAGEEVLAGSLFLPDGPGPFPAVVFVAGRGYGDRRDTTWENANRLAPLGWATLAWDGVGTGASTGVAGDVTGEQRVADVLGALAYLRTRDEIRQDQVGLFSGSAGGWVAPLALQRDPSPAFWIASVPPFESLADQQGHVVEYRMRWFGEGYSEADYAEAFAFQRALVTLSWEDAPWEAFERLMEPARSKPWWPEVDQPDGLAFSELDYYRRRKLFDAAEALETITTPTLAIFGERDYVVPPDVNVPELEAAFAAAGNEDVTVVVLPGANHSVAWTRAWVGEGEWPARFYRPWSRPPAYFETIVDWLRERTDPVPGAWR